MYRSRHDRLFRKYQLDSFLRQRSAELDTEVRSLSVDHFNEIGEEKLKEQLLSKYRILSPVLDESKIDIDVQEETIQVRDEFGSRFDRREFVSVPGLAITVKVPFTGLSDLFNCTASTWSPSGTPDGQVDHNHLMFSYETRESDPEKIKSLWKSDIDVVKQNLGWISKDLDIFNNSLQNVLSTALAQRKSKAESTKSLIEKLKE